jgi:hypothetical protein
MLKNSDHLTYFDNPEDLQEIIIGFFNRTIKHTFQPKPRSPFTSCRKPVQRQPLVYCQDEIIEGEYETVFIHKRDLEHFK